ncbi:MAG: hypothetical protein KKC51_00790 [Verrucomicrobia bacterium]|nr:hypothetical protein [Verrucomicrobiota bacterium]
MKLHRLVIFVVVQLIAWSSALAQQGPTPEGWECIVSITGTNKTIIYCDNVSDCQGASQYPTINLTAVGNPSGGTYAWWVASGPLCLLANSGASVDLRGYALGNGTVTVRYTDPDGRTCESTHGVEVVKPASLSIIDQTTEVFRNQEGKILSHRTSVKFQVHDNKGAPLPEIGTASLEWTEDIRLYCVKYPYTDIFGWGGGPIESDGTFIDTQSVVTPLMEPFMPDNFKSKRKQHIWVNGCDMGFWCVTTDNDSAQTASGACSDPGYCN